MARHQSRCRHSRPKSRQTITGWKYDDGGIIGMTCGGNRLGKVPRTTDFAGVNHFLRPVYGKFGSQAPANPQSDYPGCQIAASDVFPDKWKFRGGSMCPRKSFALYRNCKARTLRALPATFAKVPSRCPRNIPDSVHARGAAYWPIEPLPKSAAHQRKFCRQFALHCGFSHRSGIAKFCGIGESIAARTV